MFEHDRRGAVRFLVGVVKSQRFRLVEKEFKLCIESKTCKTTTNSTAAGLPDKLTYG
jgi:hypothetical protein